MTDKAERSDEVSRKPYTRPQLRVYGDLQEITREIGMNGLPDSGSGGNMETA